MRILLILLAIIATGMCLNMESDNLLQERVPDIDDESEENFIRMEDLKDSILHDDMREDVMNMKRSMNGLFLKWLKARYNKNKQSGGKVVSRKGMRRALRQATRKKW